MPTARPHAGTRAAEELRGVKPGAQVRCVRRAARHAAACGAAACGGCHREGAPLPASSAAASSTTPPTPHPPTHTYVHRCLQVEVLPLEAASGASIKVLAAAVAQEYPEAVDLLVGGGQ